MTREQMIETVRDALRAAGFADDEGLAHATGNIVQVWLTDQEYQTRGCEILREMVASDAPFDDQELTSRAQQWARASERG